MLELRNITKIYNPGEVTESCLFRDFSLTVQQGEFVSIVGSNGSGKTSLLNIICGSTGVQSGDILIDGASMLHQKEYIRYRRPRPKSAAKKGESKLIHPYTAKKILFSRKTKKMPRILLLP